MILFAAFTSVGFAEDYAIIFAGGANTTYNWPRYYNNVMRYYEILTDDLSYKPENVWVISSDGTNAGADQNIGSEEHPNLINSDYSSIVANGSSVLSATGAHLQTTIQNLDLGAEDYFHLWTFDHGGGTKNAPATYGEEVLNGWYESIADEDLNSWCSGVNAGREVYVFGQCYAGGMLDNFNIGETEVGRFGASATNHYESSYGSAFVGAWADSIDSGETDAGDLFIDALAGDGAAQGPTQTWTDNGGTWVDGVEHPWCTGDDNIDIAVAKYQGKGTGVYTTHFWSTAQNWTYQPDYSRSVNIEFTQFTGDVVVNSTGCYAGYLTADWSSAIGSSGFVQIDTGGQLYSRYQVIGEERYGKVLHDDGSNTVAYDLTVARRNGSTAYYDQNGGTVNVSSDIFLGRESGAVGYYYLDGGTLTTAYLNLGQQGTGYMDQAAGTTCTVTGTLSLGYEPGAWGDYDQNGGSISANYEYIGREGTGYYTQTSGTNTITNRLYLGRYSTGYGVYTLEGGNLSADEIYVGYSGSTGYFYLKSNTLDANTMTVNENGTMRNYCDWTYDGDLNIHGEIDALYWDPYDIRFQASSGSADASMYTGGSLDAVRLELGYSAGTTGTFTQEAGTVNCDYLYAGGYGTGTYTQNSGNANVAYSLYVGGYGGTGLGTYYLNSGATLSTTNDFVGLDATGVFNQTGGTHTIENALYMGRYSDNAGDGTYNQSGGTLSANYEYVGYEGSGDFVHSGGTNSIAYTMYLGRQSTAQGMYTLSSTGTLNVSTIYCGYSGGGLGIFNYNGGTLNTDTINIVNGSSKFNQKNFDWTFDGHIQIDGGLYDAGSRILTLDSASTATLNMTSGQINANYLRVGDSQKGEVTQTLGTTTLSNYLQLGYSTGSEGTYTLNGGSILSHYNRIGYSGTGTFTQNGGTNDADYNVILGYNSGASGTYNLYGGTLTTGTLYIGYNGAGVMNYTGGALDPDSTLVYSQGQMNVGLDWTCDGSLNIYGGVVDFGTSANELKLDNAGTAASCNMTSGTLTTYHQWIGVSDLGDFTQSGGTNTLETLFLAYYNGSNGDYTLNGGTVNAGRSMVGYHGTGTLSVNSGTFNSPQYIYVGRYSDGDGTLNLSGGTLSTNNLVVGYDGSGEANYSGGTLDAGAVTVNSTGLMNVDCDWTYGGPINVDGGNLDASGYELAINGGSASLSVLNAGSFSASNFIVGQDGSGQVMQTDGTLTASNYLYVGNEAGSDGVYQIDAGSATCTHFRLGYFGTGAFIQNGGSVYASGNSYIGVSSGGDGTYTMNAGQFSTPTLNVGTGGSGLFDYYDGTLSINTINVGANGQFDVHKYLSCTADVTISGGSFDTHGNNFGMYGNNTWVINSGTFDAQRVYMGYYGSTDLTQNNGAVTVVENLYQGYYSGNSGDYVLANGSLSSTGHIVGVIGSGTFTQSGGSNTASSFLTLGSNAGSFGSYSISGGTLTAGTLKVGQLGHGELHITNAAANINLTNELIFGQSSVFDAVPGSVIHMTGSDLTIQNADSANMTDLNNLTLIFEGGPAVLDLFEVAGVDLGNDILGWTDNFALDTLQLGGSNYGRIQFVNNYDNNPSDPNTEALYVFELVINPYACLVQNGYNLYYLNGSDPKEFFFGDANLDGDVNELDLDILVANWGSLSAGWDHGDFTGGTWGSLDGQVNGSDLDILGDNWTSTTVAFMDALIASGLLAPGDANADGVVNQLDLNAVIDNWQASGVGWTGGDFNDDDVVNQLDLNTIIDNWQAAVFAQNAVPEPNSFILILVGIAGLVRKR